MTNLLYWPIFTLFFCLGALNCYAWNAAGHKIVAQVAYDHLTPKAKGMCYQYLRSPKYNIPNSNFVRASTWMDNIRFKEIAEYDVMHYIDIPFSLDGTPLPSIAKTNAVIAIKKAVSVLSSKKAHPAEKKRALRMLIHIIGDIHQPLHSITKVSARHPQGDLGGNLFFLGKNPVGKNLHQYWDNGAGFLLKKYDEKRIKLTAQQLEQKYPCSLIDTQNNPKKWAKISHKLAIKNAYQLNPRDIPRRKYQLNAQLLVQKQMAYAGCRLAALLNNIAQT